jgi:hypothetical protein
MRSIIISSVCHILGTLMERNEVGRAYRMHGQSDMFIYVFC